MHIHTWASDGTWSPKKLVEKLKEKNIKIFSITDHDTIESSEEMQNHVDYEDMIFIKGVEVATTYKNREYHLTSYNYNKTKDFIDLIDWNNDTRLEYNYKFIELKSKISKNISLEDYFKNYDEDRSKGGWKALNYLLDKKIYKSMYEYFSALKETNLQLEFKKPEEVIQILKQSGATVFLAHPSYYYKDSVMPEIELMHWKNLGIDGIECFTPYADKTDQINYYKEFCNKYGLMISGGSDCHGEFLDRELGYPNISLKDLKIEGLINSRFINNKFSAEGR
jgi:predicted metal-dependent phosphoesterase TrpH